MDIEYEAKFAAIDKEVVRARLTAAGAILRKPEFLQKRVVFRMPTGHEMEGAWVRVRDEGDRITMSLKAVTGDKIENQKEICVQVGGFPETVEFLQALGCTEKSYQETKRELWTLDGAEVTLDEWPFIKPFVEIEAASESGVREVAERLGLDYTGALFGAVDVIYTRQYPGLTADQLNNRTPRLVFGDPNPFGGAAKNRA